MKKNFFLSLFVLISLAVSAQTKKPAATLPDVNKMMQMSPAELEQYKQKMLKQASAEIKDLSTAGDIKIDETVLPDFEIKPPPKDLNRLAMIPLKVPSKMELMAGVQQSLQQIQAIANHAVKQEAQKMATTQNAAQLESSSVALWYQDKPVEALLTSIAAVQKSPDQVIPWNNLAALYNMAGLEEKAIPILMHHLQESPDNSLLLNNIGQSFLGLGDMERAEQFFQHCLTIDESNPEANRSMGMIHLFKKQYSEAQKYFEKELEVAHRRSTLALMHKQGIAIDLNAIRNRRTGLPHRDYFEEIGLGKFVMPDFPQESGMADAWNNKNADFLKSLFSEFYFWSSIKINEEAIKQEGKRPPGIYADLEDELTRELGDEFIPLLSLFTESENNQLKAMYENYTAKLYAVTCPEPPTGPNVGMDVILAYKKKCCDARKAIADAYVAERNAFVKNKFIIVSARWKEYINGMISNVRLNPTEGNKQMVYKTVGEYLSFIIFTIQSGASFEPLPADCYDADKITSKEAEAIIQLSHDIDFSCPSWLNVDIDLQAATLKADCSKYAIEAGKGFMAGYEKNFKTGTSTLTAGVGASQKFGGIAKVGVKQMVYISFDNNNQFSDFGLKGTVEGKVGVVSEGMITEGIGKVGTTIAGAEGGYTLGLNSGFKSYVKGKGLLSGYIH
ncbi:MAG: hypothetical protein JSU05_00410 [Bacteroidetes bacterium]|nr:hypothetical protein [Bacteroidota bacterium]